MNMDYAVVIVPAAPVRRKPWHQSEMTSQLLFGETVKLLKQKGNLWVKVRSLHDDYEGWMTHTLLQETKEDDAKAYSDYVSTGFLNVIHLNESKIRIPMGASLPGFLDGSGKINGSIFQLEGEYHNRSEHRLEAGTVKQLTSPWLNAPYLWGGRTMLGIDCSGFVQVNYKMMGIDLPRDAWQQAQEGDTVRKLKEAVCGDLAFFDDKEEIVHVGILLGDDQIIHAAGKVRIDNIDKKGIINSDTGKRTHSLRVIKRCG
jgi:gamma-D-glutamyl-L-lysine dipeptidyl-peptidase